MLFADVIYNLVRLAFVPQIAHSIERIASTLIKTYSGPKAAAFSEVQLVKSFVGNHTKLKYHLGIR